jgi:hypothetical protein
MSNILTSNTKPTVIKFISLVALLIFMPILLYGTNEIIVLLTRASGTRASIVINTKLQLEQINTDFYHAFAQGGAEPSNMLASVSSLLPQLRPKIIRVDHVFDAYGVVNKQGEGLAYSWDKLDSVIDTITASGAKPMIALSYMPPAIAKDGIVINQPNNWNDWAQVVQRLIEHYSGKSEKNISGIYYEVWNEPDLAQFGSWRYWGGKNYLTLYQFAANGAQKAQNVNNFYLGGPATTGLYKEWVLALMKSGMRINFLSWHTYERNPLKYSSDQQNVISWLLPYPNYTLIPKIISEFGFTGDHSTSYGTAYAAAHVAAVVRQLVSGGPSYIVSFQLKDGPNQQSGDGWGVITHEDNGLKQKPRYYIYSFLDSMAGKRVSLSGEGTWVTGFASIRDNTLRVMLVNFDPNGSHSETVPVTFGSLDPGSYKFRQRYFSGQDTTITETVSGDILTKKINMPASTIIILELTRQ